MYNQGSVVPFWTLIPAENGGSYRDLAHLWPWTFRSVMARLVLFCSDAVDDTTACCNLWYRSVATTILQTEVAPMTSHAKQSLPEFIYGTAWKEDETRPLVELALDCGFRAIDTANQRKHYHEAAVGEAVADALEEGQVARDDLFLQTKFTHVAGQDDRLPYDAEASFSKQVEQSFQSSLDHLQVDAVDSYILHGPSTRVGLADADREVWEAMEALEKSGQTRFIGASNISPDQLETLVDFADVAPTFVQNRCFARAAWDREVRAICEANDIHYQGFSLLTANVQALRTQEVADIAERHDRTVPQIVFRFALEVGMIPLTGTTDQTHMDQDLAIFDFELGEDEVETIEEIALP